MHTLLKLQASDLLEQRIINVSKTFV